MCVKPCECSHQCSYLGRNRVDWSGTEARIATWLVQPHYSHFLVGYLLSSRGAQKLLDADPFHSLLPADDFITVMYGRPLWYIDIVLKYAL